MTHSIFALLLGFLVIVYNVGGTDLKLDSLSAEDLQLAGRQRKSWSAFQLGWKKLLQGTRLVRNEAHIVMYRKHGSFDQALEEFLSLNPSNVRRAYDGSLLGTVGDTDIYFRGRRPDRDEPDYIQALLIIPSKHEAPKVGFSSQTRKLRGIQYFSHMH